jgi:hypothetical protein
MKPVTLTPVTLTFIAENGKEAVFEYDCIDAVEMDGNEEFGEWAAPFAEGSFAMDQYKMHDAHDRESHEKLHQHGKIVGFRCEEGEEEA